MTGYLLQHGVNLEKSVTLPPSQLSYTIDGIVKGNCQYQIVAMDAVGKQKRTEAELRLSAADLFNSNNDKKQSPLLAMVS